MSARNCYIEQEKGHGVGKVGSLYVCATQPVLYTLFGFSLLFWCLPDRLFELDEIESELEIDEMERIYGPDPFTNSGGLYLKSKSTKNKLKTLNFTCFRDGPTGVKQQHTAPLSCK